MRSFITALALTLASTSLVAGAAQAAPPEEGWSLARAILQRDDDAAMRTLVGMLESERPEVAARAAKVVRVIGVAQPSTFRALLARPGLTTRGLAAVSADVRNMPAASERRATLSAIVASALASSAPVADSAR